MYDIIEFNGFIYNKKIRNKYYMVFHCNSSLIQCIARKFTTESQKTRDKNVLAIDNIG